MENTANIYLYHSILSEVQVNAITDYTELMINIYAPAGFIYPHYDSVDNETILNDQYVEPGQHRIATAMLYLSTVEGGATIFPNLGISVFPTQGSLLFWYNTYSDGNRNDFTLHASCPVLEGVKIIGNKWIHYQEQTFKKPCNSKDRKFILNNNSPET